MKIILLCCLLITAEPAFAYLDPGSGNALVYLLISLGGAVIYFFKNAFYKILSLFSKKYKDPKANINSEVVLFCEGPTYWYTFKPLAEELISRKIHFKYISLDVRDPGLKISNTYMHSRFLGFGAGAYARAAAVNGTLFFATTPNIGCVGYPLPRPSKVKKMIHLSHTVGDITYLKKGSLDQYDEDWDIAPWCEKRMRIIESKRNLKPKAFKAVGLLYLDELLKQTKEKTPPQNNSVDADAITVLVAPSWGAKCCLKVHGYEFIGKLLESGFKVIFRPHPQSLRFDAELINEVISKYQANKNFEVNLDVDSSDAMNRASIMISDSSSVRFDFAFLQKKPVITMYVAPDDLSSFEADDLGGPWETDTVPRLGAVVHRGENINLPELVKTLVVSPKSGIDELYDELVVNHGTSASHIVDLIEKELSQDPQKQDGKQDNKE